MGSVTAPRTITSDDLSLLPPVEDDAALVAELMGLPADAGRPAEIVRAWREHWEEHGYGTWIISGAAGRAVGFVILSGAWIEQVGVDPTWRGKGLGAHLVARSLTALQRAGADRVWLAVASDNPSRVLYERLGFRARGTRARYERRSDDR